MKRLPINNYVSGVVSHVTFSVCLLFRFASYQSCLFYGIAGICLWIYLLQNIKSIFVTEATCI